MVIARRLGALITLFLFVGMAQAAISAQVDRTELYNDESLVLTVTVSPVAELNSTDLAALASLFSIDQRAQQQSSQNINGRALSRVDYQFRLSSKASGVIGIPSIRAGNEQSEPIFITVLDARQRGDSLAEDAVQFSGRLSNNRPYVDQPFEIVLEFAYKIQVKGAIETIDLDSFETRLVKEENTSTTLNGQTYNLYRQVLELTPKNPGAVKIPTIVFIGEYPDSAQGRYVRFSRTIDLDPIEIRAIPASFPSDAYWLPATSLSLTDNLDTSQPIDQNSHLDWQISTQTQGLAASRLPDPLATISASLDSRLRLYRNEATFSDSQRLDSAALTIDTPGTYRIPAIRIPWWNTNTDTLAWAELPERTIRVVATTQVSPKGTGQAPGAEPLLSPVTRSTGQPQLAPSAPSYWLYATLLAGLGWLLTLGLWWHQVRTVTTARSKDVLTPGAVSTNWAAAQRLAKASDYSGLYQCLLRLTGPGNDPLTVVKARLDQTTRQCFEDLERSLFSDQAIPPSASAMTALGHALERLIGQTGSASTPDKALRLYPD
jgi:hypothetical protein